MDNVIYEDYQKEYIEKYNETNECLKNILWDLIFLIQGNKFLNNRIPLSTKPVIEKIYNDVKIAFNIRIKSLLEENNVLKNLETAMETLYLKESHKENFVNSLKHLSWNFPETENVRNNFTNQNRSVQDAEIILKSAYEYLKNLAVDNIPPASYEQDKSNCDWFAGCFFELNNKHGYPISLTF